MPMDTIQATGMDAAGRRQYLYHHSWREQKDRIKFDRALSLAESLPAARRRVTMDLRAEEPTRERVLATAFRMLDTGSLRVGSEQYAESNGSHGLATLLCSHATVSGDVVSLHFPAKSAQEWRQGVKWHPVVAQEINAYVRERTGGEFTAKDFRTLHGTVAAAVSLAKHGTEPKRLVRNRAIAQAMWDVSTVLGNSPLIARKSYVDPRIIDRYIAHTTIDPQRLNSAETELRTLLFE
jgi:DNA topoisomerase-1